MARRLLEALNASSASSCSLRVEFLRAHATNAGWSMLDEWHVVLCSASNTSSMWRSLDSRLGGIEDKPSLACAHFLGNLHKDGSFFEQQGALLTEIERWDGKTAIQLRLAHANMQSLSEDPHPSAAHVHVTLLFLKELVHFVATIVSLWVLTACSDAPTHVMQAAASPCSSVNLRPHAQEDAFAVRADRWRSYQTASGSALSLIAWFAFASKILEPMEQTPQRAQFRLIFQLFVDPARTDLFRLTVYFDNGTDGASDQLEQTLQEACDKWICFAYRPTTADEPLRIPRDTMLKMLFWLSRRCRYLLQLATHVRPWEVWPTPLRPGWVWWAHAAEAARSIASLHNAPT